MTRVETRHVDPATLTGKLDMYEHILPINTNGAQKNSRMLNNLQLSGRDYANILVATGGSAPKLRQLLHLRLQAISAIFCGVTSGQETFVCTIGDQSNTELKSSGLESFAHTTLWIDGFFTAALLRDVSALDYLCSIPIEVIRQSTTRTDEYSYLMVDVLRGFWLGDQTTPALLEQALEATDSRNLQLVPEEYVLNIDVPKMELLFMLMAEDEIGFNSALVDALENHKAYWRKAGRNEDSLGYFPLPLAGLAAFARDRGMRVSVESGYLPESIVYDET